MEASRRSGEMRAEQWARETKKTKVYLHFHATLPSIVKPLGQIPQPWRSFRFLNGKPSLKMEYVEGVWCVKGSQAAISRIRESVNLVSTSDPLGLQKSEFWHIIQMAVTAPPHYILWPISLGKMGCTWTEKIFHNQWSIILHVVQISHFVLKGKWRWQERDTRV